MRTDAIGASECRGNRREKSWRECREATLQFAHYSADPNGSECSHFDFIPVEIIHGSSKYFTITTTIKYAFELRTKIDSASEEISSILCNLISAEQKLATRALAFPCRRRSCNFKSAPKDKCSM
ncbi:hypothetical protein CIHG_01463 [Coccidioides immitis H538.4]|uniref:Uncharacterized protein n=2 Tax=Coccidioides immitis TaxID=5501 RepID=A0A0J8RER3_COCIT|nr:hypothetical protein CIRG_01313 [Coccidioides immitis RMSCC 2394]KMU83680.1 hypothetical protein CIHG_01463 [Coccidioides immitis H538.4]